MAQVHSLDVKSRNRHVGHQSHNMAEVVCPKPRRSVPLFVDEAGRFSPMSRNVMPTPKSDCGSEFLDSILSKDVTEDASLETGSPASFFNGSPPPRTSNPIVHDVQFTKQLPPVASPSRLFGEANSPAGDGRRSPSRGSCAASQPRIRVEGFSGRRTDYHGIVSA